MKLIETYPVGIGTFCVGGGYYLDIKKDFADYDNDEKYIEALRYSLKLGQNHIDTAYTYGDGHTEAVISKAIKGLDRSKIYIADKLPKSHMRRSAVIPAIKEMLRRLDTEYLDLVYVHDVNVPEPMEGYLDALSDAVNLGLIREIGISNANLEQTKMAVKLSKYPIVANQIRMNPLDREKSPEELLEYCEEFNIKVVAYVPLNNPNFFKGLNESRLENIAKKYNKSVQSISLNWLINHKKVLAIPKATTREHIEDNYHSIEYKIEEGDLKAIDNLYIPK